MARAMGRAHQLAAEGPGRAPVPGRSPRSLRTMEAPGASHWERGERRGPRRLLVAAIVLLLLVGACGVGALWIFNSPGFRVAREIYESSRSVVNGANYANVAGQGEVLTIITNRDVSRQEALTFQCDKVVPLLARERLSPRIVLRHPDGDFVLQNEPCPRGS